MPPRVASVPETAIMRRPARRSSGSGAAADTAEYGRTRRIAGEVGRVTRRWAPRRHPDQPGLNQVEALEEPADLGLGPPRTGVAVRDR